MPNTNDATLQTVLQQLSRLPGVTVVRKREMASAIEVFCRTLNRHPSEIVARLDMVERLSRDLNAVRMGITLGRLRNIKCLVRNALKVTGHSAVMKQLRMPLDHPWSVCVRLFSDRRGLVTFAALRSAREQRSGSHDPA